MSAATVSKGFDEAINWLSESMQKHQLLLEDKLEIMGHLQAVERENEITLSPGARLMLLIPLLEIVEAEDLTKAQVRELRLPPESQIYQSFALLARGSRSEAAEFDIQYEGATREEGVSGPRRLSSLSIIKQFWKRFCSIPPFCGERKQGAGM